MYRSPVFWLRLALAVFIAGRCANGLPTRSQLRQFISTLLYEDKLNADVLSERVKLSTAEDNLPPCAEEMVPDLDDVDPLPALLALSTAHPHYSGDNLNLSLTIVGKCITCLMHKRVAFHLALIIRLIQNTASREHFSVRARVFAHVVPLYVDMLSSIYVKYDQLLSVYDMVSGMVSALTSPEAIDYDANVTVLVGELKVLSDVIKSSCVVYEIKEYCHSLRLEALKDCSNLINDENLLTDEVSVDDSVDSLKKNENAIWDLFDEMDLLRSMDMDAWNVWLKIPKLNDDDQFVRTPRPRYRNEVEEVIRIRELETTKSVATLPLDSVVSPDGQIAVEQIVPVVISESDPQAGPSDASTSE